MKMLRLFENTQFQNIVITQLFTVVGSNVLLPVLPVYLKFEGFSDSQIGFVMGIAAIGALVVRPLVGYSVDTKGSRLVILIGQVLTWMCISAFLFVSNFISLLVLRFFNGVAFAFYGTGAITFASSVETSENTAGAISLYTVFTMIGLGIATASAPILFPIIGFKQMIVLALSVLSLGICVILFRAKTIFPYNGEARVPFMQVLKTKEVIAPTVCLFASNFAFSSSFTFIPLVAMAYEIQSYAIFYIAFTVAVVSARLIVQQLVDKYTAERVSTYASLLNAVSVFIIAARPSVVTFGLSGIFVGLGFGIIFPALAVYVVNNSNPASKGTALSILSAAGDIGSALGASVLGIVAQAFGYRNLFISSTAVVLICTYYFYMSLVMNSGKDAEKNSCSI